MLRQMRCMYAKTNKLLRMFGHCTVDVKIALFNSYCTSLYCSFLWTDFKKSTFSKVRIAFNNAYRRIFGLPKWSSASEMYACNNIDNFETMMRRGIYGFVQRLESCENSVVQSINKSWVMKFFLNC